MLSKLEEIKHKIFWLYTHNKNYTKEQYNKIDEIHESLKDFTSIKKILNEIYLEYFNNYLTIEKFAENEEINTKTAKTLIEIGKKINNMEV